MKKEQWLMIAEQNEQRTKSNEQYNEQKKEWQKNTM